MSELLAFRLSLYVSTASNTKSGNMANMEHNKVTDSGVQLKLMVVLKPILNNQLLKLYKMQQKILWKWKCLPDVSSVAGGQPRALFPLRPWLVWSVCTTHQPAGYCQHLPCWVSSCDHCSCWRTRNVASLINTDSTRQAG